MTELPFHKKAMLTVNHIEKVCTIVNIASLHMPEGSTYVDVELALVKWMDSLEGLAGEQPINRIAAIDMKRGQAVVSIIKAYKPARSKFKDDGEPRKGR